MSSCADLAPPAPLQRFIDHQIDAGSYWHKGFDNEQEELAAYRQRRPASPVEHLVKEAPVAGLSVAAGAQSCCNSAASSGEQRSGSQDHQFSPRGSSKQWPKDGQNFYNGVGKGHEYPPGEIWLWSAFIFPQEAFMPRSFPQNVQSQE